MFIKSVYIKKFRGFEDISFQLGTNLTIIAGQNGTQKTTLLGILSQPFTITDKTNSLYGEKPLCGGNYKSLFSEKFKLSDAFDKPQGHEWTLEIDNNGDTQFTIESIKRSRSQSSGIRFWRKGSRSKGSGYIQLPVIYLSLSRLFPIGEDSGINTSTQIVLTNDELKFYQEWHNKILIIPDVEMTTVAYLKSKQKNTLGVGTAFYDWRMNSAGQDNIGKILLAILSFKRLKEAHSNVYKGGILVIDELDATLYPASQIELINALRTFSSRFNIQVIVTTHSLNILEKACEWQSDGKLMGQVRVVYLQKIDAKIKVLENLSIDMIKNKLNIALVSQPAIRKILIFTEDYEGEVFLRAILKRKTKCLEFAGGTLGCDNLIELAKKKIRGFKFPDSIIALDGDVNLVTAKAKKIKGIDNIVVLPGDKSPERLFAEFLHGLSDESPIWEKIWSGYSKQHVFRKFSLQEILTDRIKAKEWFNTQKQFWGRNCANVINPWMENNQQVVDAFLIGFETLIDKY